MWPGGRYEVLLIDEFGPNNSIFAVYYVKEKALVSGRVAGWNAGLSGLTVSPSEPTSETSRQIGSFLRNGCY